MSARSLPEVGQPAPAFSLPSQGGDLVSLTDLAGKWVVLYFYPKDNTPGCTIEARDFQRDLALFEGKNAMVLGVSLDSESSHRSFCAKRALTFKLLSDRRGDVARAYGSLRSFLGLKTAARNTFLIDPQGMMAKVWTGVSPAGHSVEVLRELEARVAKKE